MQTTTQLTSGYHLKVISYLVLVFLSLYWCCFSLCIGLKKSIFLGERDSFGEVWGEDGWSRGSGKRPLGSRKSQAFYSCPPSLPPPRWIFLLSCSASFKEGNFNAIFSASIGAPGLLEVHSTTFCIFSAIFSAIIRNHHGQGTILDHQGPYQIVSDNLGQSLDHIRPYWTKLNNQ